MNRIENSGKHPPGVLRVKKRLAVGFGCQRRVAFILPLTAGDGCQRIDNGARRGNMTGNKHTATMRKAPRLQARTAEEEQPREDGRTAAHRARASSLGARHRRTEKSSVRHLHTRRGHRRKAFADSDAPTEHGGATARPPNRSMHGSMLCLWGRFPRTNGWSIVSGAAMKLGELRGSELQNASKPQLVERCR